MRRMALQPGVVLKPFAYSGPVPPEMAAGVVLAGNFQHYALASLTTGLPLGPIQNVFGRQGIIGASDRALHAQAG